MLQRTGRSARDLAVHAVKGFLSKVIQVIQPRLDLAAKSSYATKVSQHQLYSFYQGLVRSGAPLPALDDVGYRVFSQFEEDGILAFIFAVIGTHAKTFVDIGAGDGINSNCANLAVNFGWYGLFIDGNPENIRRGEAYYHTNLDTWLYPPLFRCSMVKRSNINQIISTAGFTGEIDLLSIDIDGNDYWIWDALTCVQPRVVIIETRIQFGYENVVVPYDEDYVYPGKNPDYFGASPVAMRNLAHRKGYRLVGANNYGFNTIYVRDDIAPDLLPEVSVEHILRHPLNREHFEVFKAVRHLPYVEG